MEDELNVSWFADPNTKCNWSDQACHFDSFPAIDICWGLFGNFPWVLRKIFTSRTSARSYSSFVGDVFIPWRHCSFELNWWSSFGLCSHFLKFLSKWLARTRHKISEWTIQLSNQVLHKSIFNRFSIVHMVGLLEGSLHWWCGVRCKEIWYPNS